MALHKNILILITHYVSVYSVKQCINSNVTILTVIVILIRSEYVYQQFWTNTGSKKHWQKPVSAKVAETLVETCFCQDGLNIGLTRCWQKLANTGRLTLDRAYNHIKFDDCVFLAIPLS